MLLLAGAATGFASLGALASIAYADGVGSPTFVALRAAVGAGLLALYGKARGSRSVRLGSLAPSERRWLLIAIVVNGAMSLALFAAFDATTVASALAVFFTYPAVAAAIAVGLGRERLNPARAAGLATAVGGVAVMLLAGLSDPGVTVIGLALAFGAALAQAAYLTIVRAGFPSVPPEQATGLVLVGGAAVAMPLAAVELAASGIGWATSATAWGAVLAASVIGTAIPKVWVIRGVRMVGATRAGVIMLAEPAVGALIAAIVLGQSLGPGQVAGGALIVVGAALVQRPSPGPRAVSAFD